MESAEPAMLSASRTRLLPLAKLHPGKNPRRRNVKVADLVESFGHAPLLQNIVARRLPGPRDEYEIVCGHRRYEASGSSRCATTSASFSLHRAQVCKW
jgi:ParB-like chromosome segregation protein Spo0J